MTFAPESRLIPKIGSGLSRTAKAWPWNRRTPTGELAVLNSEILVRPIRIAIGRVEFASRDEYNHSVNRSFALFFADVTYDPAARRFTRTSKVVANRHVVDFFATQGVKIFIDSAAPTAQSFSYEPSSAASAFKFSHVIDDAHVGWFMNLDQLLADEINPAKNPRILSSPAVYFVLTGRNVAGLDPIDIRAGLLDGLDPDQKAAVRKGATRASFVLRGPPGTGKTHLICRMAAIARAANLTVAVGCTVPGVLTSAQRAYEKLRRSYPDLPESKSIFWTKLRQPIDQDIDLIIIDESSRLTTAESLPVLTRAAQVIVVGDELQLSPESGAPKVDTADRSLIERLTGKLSEEPIALTYHYRSNHVEQIVFSNLLLYGQQLFMAPSPIRPRGDGVELYYRAGAVMYDGARGGYNEREARDTAKLVVLGALANPERSRFAVVLSPDQKQILARAVDRERDRHGLTQAQLSGDGAFRVLLSADCQGQEADEVFLSTVIAPSPGGTIKEKFPFLERCPLRRFNVLATRARHRTVIVSSIRPTELGTSVSHIALKIFLLVPAVLAQTRNPDTPIPDKIKEEARRVCLYSFPTVVDLGAIYAVRKEKDQGDWEGGVWVPRGHLTPEQNIALFDMLVAKGWKLRSPYVWGSITRDTINKTG